MQSILFVNLGVLCLLVGKVLSGAGEGTDVNDWSYRGNTAPEFWKVEYPHCGDSKQSPIDINTSALIYDEKLTPIKMVGYDSIQNLTLKLTNNGHSVQVNVNGNITVSDGGLPGVFKLDQFHFHWGSLDSRGSEHDVNGRPFPMEMHIVHHNTKYGTIVEAMNQTDGLAVLGVFFEIGPHNERLDPLLEYMHQVVHRDDVVELDLFSLQLLLPEKDVKSYYRYHGSLTTPPCFESVIWTLFRHTVPLSEYQINHFRNKLKQNSAPLTAADEMDEVSLVDDFRPLQPLNSRFIYTSDVTAISRAPTYNMTSRIYLFLLYIMSLIKVIN